MSYRVKVKHRDLRPGRVSLQAAAVIMNALRIAVRAEAASLNARRNTRGRLTKLQRESVAMSLVGVESGGGVLLIESESSTLLDVRRGLQRAGRRGQPSPQSLSACGDAARPIGP